jgi:hypothetical protein
MAEHVLRKYPRTPHLQGSRLQPGDDDLLQVPVRDLEGTTVVVEEKIDGANAGISFDRRGQIRLQSRGHFLTGGPRERQFDLMKRWAAIHRDELWSLLGPRYVCYGEWTYAKHTVFYDGLPSYFIEFDVLDTESGRFLDTPARRSLFKGTSIHSAPVIYEGRSGEAPPMTAMVGPSAFKTRKWRDVLDRRAAVAGLDIDTVRQQTDPNDEAEGLYVKVEENGAVTRRLKWIRASFCAVVLNSEDHWMNRPILANQLAPVLTEQPS